MNEICFESYRVQCDERFENHIVINLFLILVKTNYLLASKYKSNLTEAFIAYTNIMIIRFVVLASQFNECNKLTPFRQ